MSNAIPANDSEWDEVKEEITKFYDTHLELMAEYILEGGF